MMGDALLRRKKMRAKGAQQGPGAEHPNGATAHSPAFKKLILFETVFDDLSGNNQRSVGRLSWQLGFRASTPEQQLDNSDTVLVDMPIDGDGLSKSAAGQAGHSNRLGTCVCQEISKTSFCQKEVSVTS